MENQRWVERQNKHQHRKKKNKSTGRNVIGSDEIIFCSRGLYSSEEKGQATLEEWKGNGGIGALRPSGDKYAIVVGIASDEQSINQLMTKYKNDGVSVLKKSWDITDKALLKDDKEVGTF